MANDDHIDQSHDLMGRAPAGIPDLAVQGDKQPDDQKDQPKHAQWRRWHQRMDHRISPRRQILWHAKEMHQRKKRGHGTGDPMHLIHAVKPAKQVFEHAETGRQNDGTGHQQKGDAAEQRGPGYARPMGLGREAEMKQGKHNHQSDNEQGALVAQHGLILLWGGINWPGAD